MKNYILAGIFVATALLPKIALADETGANFALEHPVRTFVVYNIERVKWVIGNREKSGDFTKEQAAALKECADGIHGEEKYLATLHGGRLTDVDAQHLNTEISQLKKRIQS